MKHAIIPLVKIALMLGLGVASGPAQSAWFSTPRLLAGGGFECEAHTWRGEKRIEVSSNLEDWSVVSTTNAMAFSMRETESGPERHRFFRVRCEESLAEPPLPVTVSSVSSTRILLEWPEQSDATAVRVYLAAEPCCPDVGPPAQVLLAELPASARSFEITPLAPAVDCFVRVVVDTLTGPHHGVVHARTRGGPDETRETRVREVLGWAPNALLVVTTNRIRSPQDSGIGLQTGWRVTRANGAAISVNAVHRHSVPVGAPSYPLGPEGEGDPNVIDVEHRLFLVLGESIGSPEVLRVEGPGGIRFILPFSDRYLETPVIQLNQVGYNPRATERYAYVSGWMGDGGPLSLAGFPAEAEVLSESAHPLAARAPAVRGLPVTLRRVLDADAGTEVRQIDLAALPAAEGVRYRVRLPGVGVSWPTAVSERAAFKSFFTVVRGLFHNRWGGDLAANYTEWSRPADHPEVYTGDSTNVYSMYPPETPRTGRRPLVGGHHDAGDFDQQLTHTKIPQLLMRAYEIAPEAFADGQLLLPESGNGVPDLLDEALWNIAAWEQLQEPDGGVRLGVESYTHPPNQGVLAHLDTLPYWTYGVGPHHTARCSGMFAQASRLVAPFDPERAGSLLGRARAAYRYAIDHAAAPAALLWGASELYRLTGEAEYRERVETIWQANWSDGSFPYAYLQLVNGDYRENINIPSDYWMGYLTAAATAPVLAAQQRTLIENAAAHGVENIQTEHAHRNSRPEGYPFGYGQGTVVEKYLDPVLVRLQFADVAPDEQQRGFNALSLAADFILGGNPNGLVYFTGLGTRRVREPLHLDSLAFIKMGLGPMPGLSAYGPSDEIYCDWCDWTEAARSGFYPPYMSLPRARRFGDVRLLILNTEFSGFECMAPHAELFAVLMRGTRATMPPASYRPGQPDHRNPLP